MVYAVSPTTIRRGIPLVPDFYLQSSLGALPTTTPIACSFLIFITCWQTRVFTETWADATKWKYPSATDKHRHLIGYRRNIVRTSITMANKYTWFSAALTLQHVLRGGSIVWENWLRYRNNMRQPSWISSKGKAIKIIENSFVHDNILPDVANCPPKNGGLVLLTRILSVVQPIYKFLI